METEKIIFSGHVQGVGFRYSCKMLADQLGITGTIHNDWNGSVIAIVQGSPDVINQFTRNLPNKISPWARISKVERTKILDTQVYHDFRII
ncbi:acylphosphatase [Xylocopilactobacillus apicola]|uniref:acylphosphatase n=1 Tax=Xylocopilactobacillus apicola TaxID=2932184 RepID=A0AAU9DWG0_9LACO|nr:acylphosphatase [Xylocopilactobacillus apicola]BDR58323.1 acylphosphatase [Xylocopilactobacillus apicola]